MCVRRLTDKHSVYAHKATADISLLGVRMPARPIPPQRPPPPPPPLRCSNGVFHSAARVSSGAGRGGGGRGGNSGHWCGLSNRRKKRKSRKLRIGHFFSLRVQMHTYPPAVALCLVSLVPSFPPSERRTASCVFRNRSPLVPLYPRLCTGLNFFFFLCFALFWHWHLTI